MRNSEGPSRATCGSSMGCIRFGGLGFRYGIPRDHVEIHVDHPWVVRGLGFRFLGTKTSYGNFV